MKYLSVCSGIEAATVAWRGLGWEPVAFAEIEKFPAAVLAHHYPNVPNLGDLTLYREWPEETLAEVDLLVGGTPCQAFSVAGKRQSLDDERGNLSLTFVNLYHYINETRRRHGRPPAIVVWENVPGVLSTKDNAFGCFLGGLLGVDEATETEKGKWDKAGFLSSETVRVGYRVLDAQYFAVAQRRRRVFLVAVPSQLVERFGERVCPSEILSLRESVLGNPPTRGAAWEGVARATAASLTSSGQGVERCGESRGQDDVVIESPSVARTLTKRMHKGFDSTLDSQTPGQQGKGGVFGSGRDSQDTFVCVAFKPGQSEAAGGTFVTEEFTPTMQGQNNGSTAVPAVAYTKSRRAQSPSDYETWVPGEVAPTQNQFDQGDTRATTVVTVFHPTQDPISSSDGSAHAMGTGSKGGCSTHAVCVTQYGGVCGSLTARHDSSPCADRGQNIVAFTQNSRDEVRKINGDGRIAGALSAEAGMHQTNYLAYGLTTEQTPKFSENAALTITRQSPTGGGQPQCVAYNTYGGQPRADRPNGGFYVEENAETSKTLDSQGGLNPAASQGGTVVAIQERAVCENPEAGPDGVGVRDDGVSYTLESRTVPQAVQHDSPMQVRRLCPSECEALQGFPIGYTDVQYRNKPAADGPRYKALGNSMAVPCMWWIGDRIRKATQPA